MISIHCDPVIFDQALSSVSKAVSKRSRWSGGATEIDVASASENRGGMAAGGTAGHWSLGTTGSRSLDGHGLADEIYDSNRLWHEPVHDAETDRFFRRAHQLLDSMSIVRKSGIAFSVRLCRLKLSVGTTE